MSHRTKVALLSLSLLLTGWVGSLATAADEHGHGEGRPEGRPGGAQGRPAVVSPRQGLAARPAVDGHRQILDQRYDHGRY
jgi:hypothetical protein